MRSAADARALLRRVDVRLTLVLSASILALLVVLLGILYFVSAHEALEVVELSIEHELARAADHLERAETAPLPAPAAPGMALRRLRPDGTAETLAGRWPDRAVILASRTPALRASFAAPGSYLLEQKALASGALLQGVHPLDAFLEERREQLGQMLMSLAIASLGVVAVSLLATGRALAPLRDATRVVESVDADHLDVRLPVRGARDDVDRHAIALNRVIERLEDSFERIRAFSADVAHELRTPVNRLVNVTELALLDPRSSDPVRALERVRETADEMGRVIEGLFLLARLDRPAGAVAAERVDLDELVQGAVDLFGPSCDAVQVKLHGPAGVSTLAAIGDRELIQRAIANLLGNALRHTPPGGEIQVDLEGRAADAVIGVSDTGPGIAEADRERVFDRFVQLDPARSASGAGLGLAIVRAIARFHHGTASAGRSALGGARFEIALPRAFRGRGSSCQVVADGNNLTT